MSPDSTMDALYPREVQVVSLVARGLSNKAIASELSLAEGTVKEYLFRIFRKLGVSNRTELAIRYLKAQAEIPVKIP